MIGFLIGLLVGYVLCGFLFWRPAERKLRMLRRHCVKREIENAAFLRSVSRRLDLLKENTETRSPERSS